MKQLGCDTELSRPYAPQPPCPGNSFQERFPAKALEWHPTKNKPYTPSNVSRGSGFLACWVCSKCGHEYRMHVYDAGANAHDCPKCANKKRGEATRKPEKGKSFGDKYPDLVPYWDTVRNGSRTPFNVRPSSTYVAHWICPGCERPYKCRVYSRPTLRGCYACGRKITAGKNSATARSESFGCLYPEKAKFWDYAANAPVTPYKVKPHSGRKSHWICPRGHKWQATVRDVVANRGCARCSGKISAPQKRLYAELSSVFPDAVLRRHIDGIECDVFLPSIKTVIEYDGWYYHRNCRCRDVRNTLQLTGMGIRVIRVRERPLRRVTDSDVFAQPVTKRSDREMCRSVFERLFGLFKTSEPRDSQKIYEYLHDGKLQNESLYSALLAHKTGPPPGQSLADLFPAIAREFDEERNGGLTAKGVGISSGGKWNWRCVQNKGHRWPTTISHRVRGQGCPFCSGRRARPDHCLAVAAPEIAKQWHPTRNGNVTPFGVPPNSGKRFWFLCEVCGWAWKAMVNNRRKGQGCPCCAGKVLTDANQLSNMKPELVCEWHRTKNKLTPDQVFAHSNAPAWWKCPRHGTVFRQLIYMRTQGHTGCKKCSSEKMSTARLNRFKKKSRSAISSLQLRSVVSDSPRERRQTFEQPESHCC
jgi:Probable Zinc-ribbon domain